MSDKTVLSITKPTPKWMTWVFRIVFNLTMGIGIWMAGTNLIPEEYKFEALLAMKGLDYLIWGIGRGFGVDKSKFDTDTP